MGRGRKNIHKDGVKFSSEHQPSPEAKSEGKRKKKLLKEISEMIVSGSEIQEIAEPLSFYFGVQPDDLDHETLADLVQLQKAIKEGDTRAYAEFKDRLRGRPKTTTDITTRGRPIDNFMRPLILNVAVTQYDDEEE